MNEQAKALKRKLQLKKEILEGELGRAAKSYARAMSHLNSASERFGEVMVQLKETRDLLAELGEAVEGVNQND